MNVIVRFEPADPDRMSQVVRIVSSPDRSAYRTGRSGDVVGDGDDDAAASPRATSLRRRRWTNLMAAASIAALVVGLVGLGSPDSASTGRDVATGVTVDR